MSAVPITLVVPVYNGERYLRALLESVKSQSCADWRCLCVDDGSTDGSRRILDEFAANDDRFQIFSQRNAGCGAARNTAIARATTPYVMFADQDDVLHPQAFECALSLMARTDADAVCFEAAPFADVFKPKPFPQDLAAIPILRRKLPPQMQFVKGGTGHSIFVWRHVWRLEKIAPVPFPPLSGGEDSVWMVELGWRGINIADAPVVLYGNRHHADSGSRGLSKRYIDNIFRSYVEMRDRGMKYGVESRLLNRFLLRLEFWFVVSAFYHGWRSGLYALRKFHESAIIESWLKGGLNAKRTEGVGSGRGQSQPRIIRDFPSICEQAVSDFSGIRVLARACAAERGRDLWSLSEDPVCCESRALIAAARACGCLLDPSGVPGMRYTLRSGESEVRLDGASRCYYKIKNPFSKLHLKQHPPQYVLFEHLVHNVLFPECRLEFLGVAEESHEARLVYRQPAVPSETRPTDSGIAVDLEARGLHPEGRYGYANESVFVTDVGQDSDNVLVDDNGFLRFIDPLIGFKKPLQKALDALSSSEMEVLRLVEKVCCL